MDVQQDGKGCDVIIELLASAPGADCVLYNSLTQILSIIYVLLVHPVHSDELLKGFSLIKVTMNEKNTYIKNDSLHSLITTKLTGMDYKEHSTTGEILEWAWCMFLERTPDRKPYGKRRTISTAQSAQAG